MFATSLTLMYLGLKSSKKISKRILIFLSLFLPCLMAGLRNVSVGTDTGNYIYNLYSVSRNAKNFSNIWEFIGWTQYKNDLLYIFLTILISKVGLSFNFLLFIYEILIIFPLYYAIKKVSKNQFEIIFKMACFYLLFYNLSLNIIRQAIAISFIVLSFAYYITSRNKKNKFFSYMYLLIATGFHSTAIICFTMLMLYKFYNSSRVKEQYKLYVSIILTILFTLTLMFSKELLYFIGKIGIYNQASSYLKKFSRFDLNFSQIILNLSLIIFIRLNKANYKRRKISYDFGIIISIMNLLVSLQGTFIHYVDRIAYYLLYTIILVYIILPENKEKKKYNIFVHFIFLVFFINWLYLILLNNANATLPYKTFWG